MTYYLYLKTHNQTGLKYLGKTSQNPFTYMGSGIRWTNHLNKHGNDVSTEVLAECQNNEEISKLGKYYSKLWNIVDSEEFANLKEETGDGGSYPHSEDTKNRMSIAKKGQVPWNKGKKYSCPKMSGAKKGTGNSMFGKFTVNDGKNNLVLSVGNVVPEGFIKGQLQKHTNKIKANKSKPNANKGKFWITNNVDSKMVDSSYTIPEGWRKGRVY